MSEPKDTTLKDLLSTASEPLGWSVDEVFPGEFELERHSPAGEDVIITLYGETLEEVAADARDAFACFDPSEPAARWYGAGRGGPSDLGELLDNALSIKDMYGELSRAVSSCPSLGRPITQEMWERACYEAARDEYELLGDLQDLSLRDLYYPDSAAVFARRLQMIDYLQCYAKPEYGVLDAVNAAWLEDRRDVDPTSAELKAYASAMVLDHVEADADLVAGKFRKRASFVAGETPIEDFVQVAGIGAEAPAQPFESVSGAWKERS